MPLVHRLANVASGKPWTEPLMEKHVYRLDRIFLRLQTLGCGFTRLVFFGRGRMRSVLILFRKQGEPTPYDDDPEEAPPSE